MTLEKKEARRLKGAAHSLKPVARIGREGISDAVLNSINDVLTARELVKVKFLENAFFDKNNDPAVLATRLTAEVVGVIGGTVILYRYNDDLTRHA
ncbi:MAG: YhbY family RNA-binding protein [Fibrobacterota bacterium]